MMCYYLNVQFQDQRVKLVNLLKPYEFPQKAFVVEALWSYHTFHLSLSLYCWRWNVLASQTLTSVKWMRSELFWDFTRLRMIKYRRSFGKTYWPIFNSQSYWTAWHLKIGPIDFPETSVRNYHYIVRNPKSAVVSFIPRRKPEIALTSIWSQLR